MEDRYYIEENWGAICDGKQHEGERMMGDEQVVIELNRLESQLAEARAENEWLTAELARSYVLRNDVLIEELRTERAELEADVVWILKSPAQLAVTVFGTPVLTYFDLDDPEKKKRRCDHGNADILRAVREARNGVS